MSVSSKLLISIKIYLGYLRNDLWIMNVLFYKLLKKITFELKVLIWQLLSGNPIYLFSIKIVIFWLEMDNFRVISG